MSEPNHSPPPTPTTTTPPSYAFPKHKLRKQTDINRKPLVLIAAGSYSPITNAHLKLFTDAFEYAKNTEFEVIGGYLSPVSDSYKKKDLATATHRIKMCELAAEKIDWLMVDPWEALKEEYTMTADVLDHFDHEINAGQLLPVRAHVVLLAGADLLQTMALPDVWSRADLDRILGQYGMFVEEREGTDLQGAIKLLPEELRENIWAMPPVNLSNTSSTLVRGHLRLGSGIPKEMVPEQVGAYIEEKGLFPRKELSTV